MTVKVTHQSAHSSDIVSTEYSTDSWSVDANGVLTVGDSLGNPEASFAEEFWFKIEKVQEDEEDD